MAKNAQLRRCLERFEKNLNGTSKPTRSKATRLVHRNSTDRQQRNVAQDVDNVHRVRFHSTRESHSCPQPSLELCTCSHPQTVVNINSVPVSLLTEQSVRAKQNSILRLEGLIPTLNFPYSPLLQVACQPDRVFRGDEPSCNPMVGSAVNFSTATPFNCPQLTPISST